MKDAKKDRDRILSKFHCPLCESTQLGNGCPFGHRPPPESKQFEHLLLVDPSYKCPLKPLPPYCCASYLALKCSKREYSFQCGAHSSAEILTRCEDGFHMELSEVDNLQLFGNKMAKVLLGASNICQSESKFVGLVIFPNQIDIQKPIPPNYISAGHKRSRLELAEDDESSCAICFDQLKNNRSLFGHLENCTHVFCAKCIHEWQNRGVNKGCPVCRKRITKILVWPKLMKTQAKKRKLFDLISGEVPSNEKVHMQMKKSRLEYFATQNGEMMQAKLMDLRSMKMFLKNPRPNWHCYVLQEMAIVGRHSNRIVRTHYRRVRSRMTNVAGRYSEDNLTSNQNQVIRSTMELRPMSMPDNVAENNVTSYTNTNHSTESNISITQNQIQNNITENTIPAILNLNYNRSTLESRPKSKPINVAPNTNDNQTTEINQSRMPNSHNDNVAISVNNTNAYLVETNNSNDADIIDFDLFGIRQRAQANQFNSC